MKSDVNPCFAVQDLRNNRLTDVKKFGQDPLVRVIGFSLISYSNNLLVGQLMNWNVNSPRVIISIFKHHILSVFLMGASPKMVRVNTPAVVAFVKNAKTFWNRTVIQRPRKSVSRNQFFSILKESIAGVLSDGTVKRPAIVN